MELACPQACELSRPCVFISLSPFRLQCPGVIASFFPHKSSRCSKEAALYYQHRDLKQLAKKTNISNRTHYDFAAVAGSTTCFVFDKRYIRICI